MILLILLLFFPISVYATDYTKIKNLFDPSILENAKVNEKSKKSQNIDFILYGIIDSGNVKKVIIKPKFITPNIKKYLNKRNYIELSVNQEVQGIKLIKIDNDTAVFKKGDSIVTLKVFQEPKNDRKALSFNSNSSPLIINTIPQNISSKKGKKINQPKSKTIHFKTVTPKRSIKKAKVKKNAKKPVVNPFLELLKGRKGVHVIKNNPSKPTTNPFLELIKRLQKK